MIRKFHEAKINGQQAVHLWGTGTPMREFLHVDDLAQACLFLMENYNEEQFINVGSGVDISIKELAEMIAEIVGFNGEMIWDANKPDGTPKKLMDVSKLEKLGWKSQISLKQGIEQVYEIFKREYANA
jgi:GDP-L-fucose synthase